MDRERIIEKINLSLKEGKIPCKKALELAKEENISPKSLGALLNEIKIKIRSCQLGCFD